MLKYPFKLPSNNRRTSANHRSNSVLIQSCSIWPNVLQELEKCKVQSLARSGGNFNRKAYISEEAANELNWWIRNPFGAFAPIKLPPFDLTIFSNASFEGLGGTDQVTEIGGRWKCIRK